MGGTYFWQWFYNCYGAVILGGAEDNNDVAVIITGVSNPDTGTSDYETG